MLINETNIEQIINTIRQVHQTTIDQRLIDLTEYLTELFQSITPEQSSSFGLLARLLHDYDDRAALKIEFLKAQCFENISKILDTNEKHLVSILEFIVELLSNSENVQEKFLDFNGYETFFHSLRYIHSPQIQFINQFILLMIEKPLFQNENSLIPSIESFVSFINPHVARSLIQWIPYLTNQSEQQYILSSIEKILLRSLQNKMMACSNGIIIALLEILNINEENSTKLEENIVNDIFSLVEKLSQFSINSEEIHFICQLVHQNRSLKKQLLQVLINAVKRDDQDAKSISAYFDLQRPNSGILLPIIRRWPSISASSSASQHFTFHCWLRLNHEIHSYPYEGRRQIYSFYSESMGLEAFVRNSSIYILITDHREVVYIELNDCDDLIDGSWRSLTIVHTAQRPSLFHSTLTCHLTIYIDGLVRKTIKDFKYVSIINTPIILSSIGSSSHRPKESASKTKNEISSTLSRSMQPFKNLFSSKPKHTITRKDNQRFYSQHVMIIDPNSQDTIFGQSIALYGQIASVWVLAETLDESQVKHLHDMGADFCHQQHSSISGDDTPISSVIYDYILTRSLFAYHPLACNGQTCIDISGCFSPINGRLMNSACLRLHSFSQSLFKLGGCPVLYPLIELFEENDYNHSNHIFSSNENQYSNPIASILSLIHDILFSPSMIILINEIIKHSNIEILGEYLNKIPSLFLDEQFLFLIEKLIESSRSIDSSDLLTIQIIQNILLDFSLWNKSRYHVRVIHLHYVFKIIKEDKKYDREKFGIQFFLDTLKQHFNLPKDDSDEQRQLRSIIYGIIKYILQINVRTKDLNAILSAISTISLLNDVITHELLDFILSLVDSSSLIADTVIDYLSESNMIEGLYSLLITNNLSMETKEIAFKIIKYFIESKRVPSHTRSLLKLETNHIGFGGVISGMALNELSQSIMEEILGLIITFNSSVAVHHLNIVLTLCSAASVDVRYIAIRKLMKYFIKHRSACHLYAKCPGWQETLAHFFVKTRRSSLAQLLPHRRPSALSTDTKQPSLDSSQESSNFNNTTDNNRQLLTPSPFFDPTVTPDEPLSEKQIEKIDPSMTESQIDFDLTQTYGTSDQSLKSNPIVISINNQDSTDDFPRFTNEIIITPPHSFTDSRDDLLSPFKIDNPITNRNDLSSTLLQRSAMTTSMTTSMTLSHDDRDIYEAHRRVISSLREFLGITSAEDSRFFIRPSIDLGDGSILLEEMCETLILAIVMVLWKGIIDSDDSAWVVRGQIFSALRHLHREYDLYLPLDYIERRILELSMETCLNDAKLDGVKQTPTYENNCRELIKLVNDFLSQSPDNHERITDNLVNGIIPILDTMLIFKKRDLSNQSTSHDEHWPEISSAGLNILLMLLGHSDASFRSQASIRIHSLLNCRSLYGREEAAYLLSCINKIFLSILNHEDSEYDTHLLSLMKIILDKSYDLLEMNVSVGDISLSKSTLDDLGQYISSIKREDWQMFIQQITEPYADHYRSMSVRPFQMNMQIWWNNCHEMMTIAIHKRNRDIGTEKSKFHNHIFQPWQQRTRSEDQRTLKLTEHHRIHQIHINNEWKYRKKYLYGERGLWLNEKNIPERHWMLSDHENIHRMRCKLIENDYFDKHEESSRLRDNLSITQISGTTRKELSKIEYKENSNDEHEQPEISSETQSFLAEEKEKITIGSKCSLITSTSIIDGEFIVTDKHIYFFELSRLKTCEKDFKYPLLWLQDIQLRRYNLRPTALEFFLINQRNFLLNFDKDLSNVTTKTRRQIFQKLIALKLPSMKSTFSNLVTIISPAEILKESKITDKWITRDISNFDYLMMLNTIAGRTYNDLNQYPIFPWVIKDYTSQVLDVNNPEIYRDFTRPMGIQNPKHIEEVKFKYESFEDPTGLIKKFHYGTHYSNAATVMHYLIRMEPFTTLHIQLQSGKFDIADRQFHSFQSSWTNIMDSPNDGKELIPEFFYLPEFLSNSNKFDLGKLQSNDQYLNDVQLPPWAHNSSEEFIRLHRLALESDCVSANLHKWIDLIFGYKQTGDAAIDAFNVFMYCSYEEGLDSDIIDDSVTRDAIDGMIQNFGQIPSQLLTEPHPQRQTREQTILQLETQGRPLNMFHHLSQIKAFFVELTSSDEKSSNPVVFISIPKNQIRSFMHQGTPDILVTINTIGVIGNNGWHSYDKSSTNLFTFERDPTLQFERNRLTTISPFSPSIDINSRLFAVSHDGKFIFSGGHWDRSLRIYSLLKTKTIYSIIHHTDVITCLTLDSTGYILVTGSRDTTCVIWNLSLTNDQDLTSFIHPERTLCGHTDEITCIGVSSELDLVVSGSLDGTCNIYTIEHGIYLRTLRPTEDMNYPIVNLKLSEERHILIQTEDTDTYLFLYSINGVLIRTRKFEYNIVDMLLSDQYIILAVNHNPSVDHSAVASRVIIKEMFEMTTIQAIRLRAQINCLYLTKDFTHLLVAVKDGKLFVLTPDKKPRTKSVSKQ